MMQGVLLQTVIALCAMINLSRSRQFQTIGGEASDIHEFAYQAAFLVDGELKCGASIISEFCALTAGHCVQKYPKGIALRVKSSFKDSGGLLMNITDFTIHPHFSEARLCNDIAVLKLPSRLQFDNFVQPVQLADEYESVPSNTESVVIGWGNVMNDKMPREMRSVKVYTVDSQACRDDYNTSRVRFPICSSMFCASVPDGQKDDSCNGDSGGPLMANGKQIGVVSSGYSCGERDFPGIYTNVSIFREWIRETCNV